MSTASSSVPGPALERLTAAGPGRLHIEIDAAFDRC